MTTKKQTPRKAVAPAKKHVSGSKIVRRGKADDVRVASFVKEFYTKHGAVMSKLAHE